LALRCSSVTIEGVIHPELAQLLKANELEPEDVGLTQEEAARILRRLLDTGPSIEQVRKASGNSVAAREQRIRRDLSAAAAAIDS